MSPSGRVDHPLGHIGEVAISHSRTSPARQIIDEALFMIEAPGRRGRRPNVAAINITRFAPRIWRVALLRDLYRSTDNIDDSHKAARKCRRPGSSRF